MSNTRREGKPKNLLRSIEKIRYRAGEHRDKRGKRFRKGQPAQNAFVNELLMYLD